MSACVGEVLWRSDQQPHFNASSKEDEGFEDEMQLKSEIEVFVIEIIERENFAMEDEFGVGSGHRVLIFAYTRNLSAYY